MGSYFALSVLFSSYPANQGRRASLCSALAPGYHISRLWRSAYSLELSEISLIND